MKREPRERHYDSRYAYEQWLRVRRARPLPFHALMTAGIWWLSIVVVLLWYSLHRNQSEPGQVYLCIIPLLVLLLDALVYVPGAIHAEIARGTLDPILSTPISSATLLGNVDRWVAKLSLAHLAPMALIIAGVVATRYSNILVPIALTPALYMFWRFVICAGLITASRPKWVMNSGLMLWICVLPVTVAFFAASYFAVDRFGDWPGLGRLLASPTLEIQAAMFFCYMTLAFAIATEILWLVSVALMDRLRRDRKPLNPSIRDLALVTIQENAVEPWGRQFDEDHLYLQWLNFRGAWPARVDSRSMPWAWRLAWLVLLLTGFEVVTDMNGGGNVFSVLWQVVAFVAGAASAFLLVLLPIVSTLLDFLLYLPRSVHDDSMNTTIQGLFMAPVPTESIVRDLRNWGIRLNLRHLAPSIVLAIGLFILIYSRNSATDLPTRDDLFMWLNFLSVGALLIAVWAFLLGTGLSSAGLPWKATSTGAILLLWTIPCAVLAGWFGYHIGQFTWGLFMANGQPFNTPPGLLVDPYNYSLDQWKFAWYTVHDACIVFALAYLAHHLSSRIMEYRRSGKW